MLRAALLSLTIAVCLVTPAPAQKPAPDHWSRLGEDRTRLLHRRYYYESGQFLQPMSQGPSPSCVGCSLAKALEVLHPGQRFSAEYAFAASRDGHVFPPWMNGSHCSWAAEAAFFKGNVPAQKYPLLDIDLTTYSAKRASQYGVRGPPETLDLIAAEYKTSGYHRITSWAELRGAVYTGHPVIVGVTGMSFGPRTGQVRDEDGFLAQEWGWFVKNWSHAMVIIGYTDNGREGVLILNSWGKFWVRGPKRFGDEPEGSFWVDKNTAEQIIRLGDAYAILPIEGLQ